MDSDASDDKMQAVVRLVLQAVDQRLDSVREQLVQITHSIAANHAELNNRVDHLHEMYETLRAGARPTLPGAGEPIGPVGTQVSPELLTSIGVLTERITTLEAAATRQATRQIPAVAPVARVAQVEQVAPKPDRPTEPGSSSRAFHRRPTLVTPVVGAVATPVDTSALVDDVAAMNAEITARLAAAVDRALGELTASAMPEVPSPSR